MHTDSICKVHVFLDSDAAGKKAFEKAQKENLLDNNSVNFAEVQGKPESELEDLYSDDVFGEIIRRATGFDLHDNGPDKAKKWADRVKNLLRKAGRPQDEQDILAIKMEVAHSAARLGAKAILGGKSGPIESLKNSLIQKLNGGS